MSGLADALGRPAGSGDAADAAAVAAELERDRLSMERSLS